MTVLPGTANDEFLVGTNDEDLIIGGDELTSNDGKNAIVDGATDDAINRGSINAYVYCGFGREILNLGGTGTNEIVNDIDLDFVDGTDQ